MNIDNTIIQKYLNGSPSEDYADEWIFHHIEENDYLFEKPVEAMKPQVLELYHDMRNTVQHFVPCHKQLWNALFPEYEKRLKKCIIQLVVGCPSPYEAMVRENTQHEEVIIFDLIRFTRYGMRRAQEIIRSMMTHECAHFLLHQDYPSTNAKTYLEKLGYMLFDEGLAHFLAQNKQLNNPELLKRKKDALQSYQQALSEQDFKQQQALLIRACSVPYWNKFACIAGMFLWADIYSNSGINGVIAAYKEGWRQFGQYIN
ncbi:MULTISPECIES: hypothetical protein [Sporolactobacillus]|uniref:DUF2268 domain-containing protein n=1 Tax=Sporolactobacillus nakayamae TaxID=269670 RepID=A0A1I2R7E3_9BACL|nr:MULTISPECIES: hypothetical protein [Sporolactobacillus]MCQ2009815.1 hypothetical protein [Sporolactobacillus sp. STSJ-5]SFG33676.1 hypothetical protein SAMN02982927_01428 [Sporolactobacillus nakayamae]